MSTSLRLVAAELTDVGRKRERNQDSVTHYIPAEPAVLAEKGALFVVCDGMGGHAAGEVASQMGVAAIRDGYYVSEHEDVVSALARAVSDANAAIFGRAREHAELGGMGTTCVALVVLGGRGFLVNIGDSRAYLVRQGSMRQVTRDHSWVAEQERAGIITSEQARTHAHRNVITRSLGHQPAVTADLFVETLQQGDRFLLCSDGLHGYVDEREIERVLLQVGSPDDAVQRLVEMANANGGPDNITAVVVDLLEVPAAVGEVTLPAALVAGGQSMVEDAPTQPMPLSGMPEGAAGAGLSPGVLPLSGAPLPPLAAPSSALGTQPSGSHGAPVALAERPQTRGGSPRRGHRAGGRFAMTVLVLLLLVAGAAGSWYIVVGRGALTRGADARMVADMAAARTALQQSTAQPPAEALTTLAVVRNKVLTDVENPYLDASLRQQGQTMLGSQIEPAVRMALRAYNAVARASSVALSAVPLTCAAGQGITALVAPQWTPPAGSSASASQVLYVLHGGQVYQVLVPLGTDGVPHGSSASCALIQVPGAASVIALAADGAVVYALAERVDGTFAVLSLVPDSTNADGSPHVKVADNFATPAGTQTPTRIAADTGIVYIAYTGGGSGAGVWIYGGGQSQTAPTQTVNLPLRASSLAATDGLLYVLLDDGEMAQINTSGQYTPLSLSVLSPILPVNPAKYLVATPVPTPHIPSQQPVTLAPPASTATPVPTTAHAAATATAPAATATAVASPTASATSTPTPVRTTTVFPSGSTIAVYAGTPARVVVADGASSRLVRLDASAPDGPLSTSAQYVYSDMPIAPALVAVAPHGDSASYFVWTGAALGVFVPSATAP